MTMAPEYAATRPAAASRGRRLLAPLGVAAGAGAVLGVLAVVDPNEPGHYPTCPWLALTGTYCPGCGTLRALHALTQGDLMTAVAHNPLTVAASVWLFLWFLTWVHRQWTGRHRTTMVHPRVLYALVAVIAAFWVLRNVPGFGFLGPV